MKKRISASILALLLTANVALAQWVVTNPVSDVLAGIKHVASYAQQAKQLQNDILTAQAQLKNLAKNPLAVVAPDIQVLVNNTAALRNKGKSIGGSLSEVSGKLDAAFKDPQGNFSERYKKWTGATNDALSAAMLNAGLHREKFKDDTTALQALVSKNQASSGNLGAIQTLGEINAAQLQESMKLRDLISAQQMAANTFMVAQATKDQARAEATGRVMKFEDTPKPPASTHAGEL